MENVGWNKAFPCGFPGVADQVIVFLHGQILWHGEYLVFLPGSCDG